MRSPHRSGCKPFASPPGARALAARLRPFRTITQGKLCTLHEITFQQHFVELCEQANVTSKPNELRHAFCTFAYVLHGENWTAQQAGHSPVMVHAHCKGLATKAEAKKWDCGVIAYAAARDAACYQLNRTERGVWELLASFDESKRRLTQP